MMLDPLHAITARPQFYKETIIYSSHTKKPPRQRRWPISQLVLEFGRDHDTVAEIAHRLVGKSGFLNEIEFKKVRSYLVIHRGYRK